MKEPDRVTQLRAANRVQPEGVDSFGFPVGKFEQELEFCRQNNADVYAAAKGKPKRGARK